LGFGFSRSRGPKGRRPSNSIARRAAALAANVPDARQSGVIDCSGVIAVEAALDSAR
jgi:hypothetical protein